MKINILCVGKTRERFVQDGIKKYLRYLMPYASVEIKEVKEEKIDDIKNAPSVRRREADRICRAFATAAGRRVIALDERGIEFSSHEFADFLNKTIESGAREMIFVLGGSMGLDESVTTKADMVLALSRWTLTHEMARLVLLEQLYRAFTIIKGKPYHH